MRPVAGLCRNQNKFHQYGLRAIRRRLQLLFIIKNIFLSPFEAIVLACPVRAERFLMVVSVNGFSA